jgi:dienelactone hydrolase
LFQDPKFDQLTHRACAALAPEGLPLGEILAVCQRIQDGDAHSWTRAWNEAATGAESQAIEQHARGQRGSARQSYLRASVFYALAARFAEPDYPVGEAKWKRARACFRQAAELRGGIETFEIPSQTHPIAGYFVSAGPGQHPALVALGGFDDSAEEMAMRFGDAAADRGWHLVAIEGPGQDASFYSRGLGFAPDYERPLRAVVDELIRRPEVDSTRIALAGFGWGGHFALRAGLHDERLGAVIADPPLIDLEEYVLTELPDQGRMESALVRRMGVRDLGSVFVKLKEFDLDKMLARDLKIRRPLLMLVSDGDSEVVLNQAREIARRLGEHTTLHRFGEEARASMQIDNLPALHAALFDWLADVGMPVEGELFGGEKGDQSRTSRPASAAASSSTRLTATPR